MSHFLKFWLSSEADFFPLLLYHKGVSIAKDSPIIPSIWLYSFLFFSARLCLPLFNALRLNPLYLLFCQSLHKSGRHCIYTSLVEPFKISSATAKRSQHAVVEMKIFVWLARRKLAFHCRRVANKKRCLSLTGVRKKENSSCSLSFTLFCGCVKVVKQQRLRRIQKNCDKKKPCVKTILLCLCVRARERKREKERERESERVAMLAGLQCSSLSNQHCLILIQGYRALNLSSATSVSSSAASRIFGLTSRQGQ